MPRRLSFLGLALTLAAPSAAQNIVVGARAEIVYVEVLVTDRQGRAVLGLSAEDFELRDDGRPVAIELFQAPADVTVAEPVPQGRPLEGPASHHERPLVVLYVDNPNLTPGGLHLGLTSLAPFLTSGLRAGSFRALVMAYDDGAKPLTRITDAAEDMAAALEAAERLPIDGARRASEEREVLAGVRSMVEMEGCLDAWPLVQGLLRSHADSRSARLRATADRAAHVASVLASLPGAKALLYLTEGLEQNSGLHLFHQYADICPEMVHRDFSEVLSPRHESDQTAPLRALAARASAGRFTVYPLDAGGLGASALADPSQEDRRYVPSPRTESLRRENLRAPLQLLADDTGGRAVFSTNDLGGALRSLPGELSQRYTLGFVPGRDPDGRAHSLGVSLLRRKGLTLRHRASYLHAGSGVREGQRALAALLLGLEEDSLGATIAAEPAAGEGGGALLRIRVTLSRLRLESADEGRSARLRILVASRGAQQGAPAVRERLVPIRLPAAPAGGDPPDATQEFVIRVPLAGGADFAVGVIDALSSAATFKRLRLGEPPASS
jgi:VWFA-related protein